MRTGIITPTKEIYLFTNIDGAKLSEDSFLTDDSNTSDVVNGLELARVFSNHSFDFTIVLFFSTSEEQDTRGVQEYLDSRSPMELAAIKYIINQDKTGYDNNGDDLMNLEYGDQPSSLALVEVLRATIDAYQLNLNHQIITGCPRGDEESFRAKGLANFCVI